MIRTTIVSLLFLLLTAAVPASAAEPIADRKPSRLKDLDDYVYIGEGKWHDVFAPYLFNKGSKGDVYTCYVYQSNSTPSRVKVQPYYEFNDRTEIYIDMTNPEQVYFEDGILDINEREFGQMCPETGWMGNTFGRYEIKYGTLKDNVLSFPAKAFVYCTVYPMAGVEIHGFASTIDGEFRIEFPYLGGEDDKLEITNPDDLNPYANVVHSKGFERINDVRGINPYSPGSVTVTDTTDITFGRIKVTGYRYGKKVDEVSKPFVRPYTPAIEEEWVHYGYASFPEPFISQFEEKHEKPFMPQWLTCEVERGTTTGNLRLVDPYEEYTQLERSEFAGDKYMYLTFTNEDSTEVSISTIRLNFKHPDYGQAYVGVNGGWKYGAGSSLYPPSMMTENAKVNETYVFSGQYEDYEDCCFKEIGIRPHSVLLGFRHYYYAEIEHIDNPLEVILIGNHRVYPRNVIVYPEKLFVDSQGRFNLRLDLGADKAGKYDSAYYYVFKPENEFSSWHDKRNLVLEGKMKLTDRFIPMPFLSPGYYKLYVSLFPAETDDSFFVEDDPTEYLNVPFSTPIDVRVGLEYYDSNSFNNEWVTMSGYALLTDPFVVPAERAMREHYGPMTLYTNSRTYELKATIEKNKYNPGRFRIPNLYTNEYNQPEYGFEESRNPDSGDFLYIDATDRNHVIIEPSDFGFKRPYTGRFYLSGNPWVGGTFDDKTFKFPEGAATVRFDGSLDNISQVTWYRSYEYTTPAFEIKLTVPNGVEDVSVDGFDPDAPAVYYDLTGRRIENPANGIYVRKRGNRIDKVAMP